MQENTNSEASHELCWEFSCMPAACDYARNIITFKVKWEMQMKHQCSLIGNRHIQELLLQFKNKIRKIFKNQDEYGNILY